MAERNPTWSRDELILALDLYKKFDGNPPGKASIEVVDLSRLLNAMGQSISGRKDDFRNPNGVYMKVMNFRRFDPIYISDGKVGLQRGGKGEKEVWETFATNPKKLEETATALRSLIAQGNLPVASQEEDEELAEAEEGRLLTRVHRQRERSRALIEKKKTKVLKDGGRLQCEACGFDFERTYGDRGHGFIEAHHTKPLSTLTPGTKTSTTDLALLCSNCHRMVHTKTPWISVEELKALIKSSR